MKRLLALSTQKFISDIVTDAMASTKTRIKKAPGLRGTGGPVKLTLGMEDLVGALEGKGVHVQKPEYYPS